MSLERKTVRGAAWTIATSVGSRVIGVIGTIIIANYVSPAIIGEVMIAVILTMTARQLSIFGFGQYVVAKPDCGRESVFHATFFHLSLGTVALLLLFPFAGYLAPLLKAKDLWRYLPGLVIAGLISRVGYMPHRILVRDLQFRTVSLVTTARELVFTTTSVSFAIAGWGGESIVFGNIARETVGAIAFVALAPRREWLTWSKLKRDKIRDLFRFGTPLWLSTNAHFAAAWWDNLLMSGVFGTARMGLYNYAYNIANVPAVNIGEPIGDVLLPSFTRLSPERMASVLRRSTALLALIVFPLAVGLGVVSPTLIATIMPPEWQPMAPYLTVLSALSVVRPIGWTVASYLQARDRPMALMWLELFKLAVLFTLIALLGHTLGAIWACAGVGIAFGLHSLASLIYVDRLDGVGITTVLAQLFGPLAASVVMVVAVLSARSMVGGSLIPAALLAVEIAVGALSFIPAALILAPTVSKDFLGLLRRSYSGKRSSSKDL